MTNFNNLNQSIFTIFILLMLGGCSNQDAPTSNVAGGAKVAKAQTNFLVREPVWGPVSGSGLQMGLWRPTNSSTICLTIRNKSQRQVRYNRYYMGNFSYVSVWMRPVGTKAWKELPRRKATRYYLSAGPSRKDDEFLAPGQKILPFVKSKLPFQPPFKQFVAQMSFYDGLEDFQWPSSLSGIIEIYVKQNTITYDNFTLQSGIIVVPKVVITDAPATP